MKVIKLNIVLQYLKYRIYQDYQTIGIFLFNAAVFKGDEVIETLPRCGKVSIKYYSGFLRFLTILSIFLLAFE